MKKYLMLSLFLLMSTTGAADPGGSQRKSASVPQQSGNAVQRGGMCFTHSSTISGADVSWNCEYLGRVTIKQIYEHGFRVIGAYSIDPTDKRSQFQYLIIEEQRK